MPNTTMLLMQKNLTNLSLIVLHIGLSVVKEFLKENTFIFVDKKSVLLIARLKKEIFSTQKTKDNFSDKFPDHWRYYYVYLSEYLHIGITYITSNINSPN